MNDLAKGLIAPIVVFIILGLLGWLAIGQVTASPDILNQSLTSIPSGTDPFAENASNAASGQNDVFLEDIADGLLTWTFAVASSGAILAIIWFLGSLVLQKTVAGPAGQSKGFGLWLLMALLFFANVAVVYLLIFQPLEIDNLMDPMYLYAYLAFSVILGFGGFWFATAIAASPVMQPSVPWAARKIRG